MQIPFYHRPVQHVIKYANPCRYAYLLRTASSRMAYVKKSRISILKLLFNVFGIINAKTGVDDRHSLAPTAGIVMGFPPVRE